MRTGRKLIDYDRIRVARLSADDDRGPTIERIRHAGEGVEIGDDQQGTRTYTIRNSPLYRLMIRRGIDEKRYLALVKYRNHWHYAGLEPSLVSVDLDRIFAVDPGAFSGMAKTERQVFHRNRYREARGLIGHQASIIVDNVVCADVDLHIAGLAVGFKHPHRARLKVVECLQESGRKLAYLWGL